MYNVQKQTGEIIRITLRKFEHCSRCSLLCCFVSVIILLFAYKQVRSFPLKHPPGSGVDSPSDSVKKDPPAFEWQLEGSAEGAIIPDGVLKSGVTYDHVVHLDGTFHTQAVGLKGGRLLASVVQITSGLPSTHYIGDIQTASNISAQPSFRVYELSYTQNLPGHFVAAAGLIDMNKFFVKDDHASTLLNSSFGISPDIADNVPVSIYPKPGLGISVARYFTHWKLQASFFQNDPQRRNSINLHKNMVNFETDFKTDRGIAHLPVTLKGGFWHHTKIVTMPGAEPHSDWGYYFIAQQSVYQSKYRSTGIFLQWGSCPVSRVQVPYYLGIGMLVNGPLNGRPQDQFSLGLTKAWTNRQLSDAETSYEITYLWQIIDQVSFQPDLQYIEHPAGLKKHHSFVCFLRLNFEVD